MSFSAIPDRINGQDMLYSWFDGLRDAGINIENFLGAGFLKETSFPIANSQGSATAVTGLIFDKTLYKSAIIYCSLRRSTASAEVVSAGKLIAIYRDLTSSWDLVGELDGDDDGVSFSIDATTGQVKYTSDTLAGSAYSGTLRFKALTFNAA